ncbi:K+-transporting ATPase ATPase C chain [Paenibacillus sp. 1_12]|uniref:potassium-transporting ATPase subunit KdpC n=1 Tax=Paenibacillus sp. 1_12 TaxID=1566278 RepID=UPI0008E89A96|nr:potassium-transporting ATPase subunit KdpC [Paenibacillus sp. 1_12]SFL38124.1 K+-transporting ATPase ATPase C chain [Paenibacillus sp. 1_12]
MNNSNHAASSTASFSLGIIIRVSFVFVVLCGIVYPLVCTGIAQLLMPANANGSMIYNSKGQIVGSELIGQKFANPKYFQGRVSSIDYKADASGSNNYAASNPEMLKRTQESIEDWKTNNPDVPVSQLPVDLITNSGSGLDPHISPQSALVQVPRISKLNGIPEAKLQQLVEQTTEGRDLGLFGEPRVNVLKLNLTLNAWLK